MGLVLPITKKGPAWEASLGSEAIFSIPRNPVSLYCYVRLQERQQYLLNISPKEEL